MLSDNNSKVAKPDREIVRVKNPMANDEFEVILPRELAKTLQSPSASIASALLRNQPAHSFVPSLNVSTVPSVVDLSPTSKMESLKGPHRIMAIENAVDEETCRMLVNYAKTQKRQRSGLVNYDSANDQMLKSNIDPNTRDTYNIDINGIKRGILRDIFYRTLTRYVEPYYGVQIEWWEEPQLLFYVDGGKYEPHIDAEYWVHNPDGTSGWKRIHDRDISILIYLNDDFEGGKLNFPDHGIKIQPRPGLLAAFPSNKDYKHGAEPTTSGERYVLVSWASALGVPKVRPQPPTYPIVRMSEFRRQENV